ncbi:MAG: uroporphyrinogen decarboxylase family protein [Chloroflexi bacterium]|nr:uroporphyrinogen decarboxylase family protein [Chloroflexota bacterium]
MNCLERVLTTLGHKEPDRVPLFLLLTMHGARELGMSIREYFAAPANVVEGQMRMQARYGHDCLYTLTYAAVEVEAWGGEIVFRDDGPPNAGQPIIRRPEDIEKLEPPRVRDSSSLGRVLAITAGLKARAGDRIPIVGVALSPFSLPVIQMGFDKYIQLIYDRPELFARLMRMNEEFCVEWANAQLEAGATAIGYFDPVSSPTITPRELSRRTGLDIARRTISRIKGPVAMSMGSGRCLPVVDDVARMGAPIIAASALEDLAGTKTACQGRMTVLGNLNGIGMRRWTPAQAEAEVKKAIAGAGQGGGFILCDNHGEIPWQVPEGVLHAISDAVNEWGRYPLDWVGPS